MQQHTTKGEKPGYNISKDRIERLEKKRLEMAAGTVRKTLRRERSKNAVTSSWRLKKSLDTAMLDYLGSPFLGAWCKSMRTKTCKRDTQQRSKSK